MYGHWTRRDFFKRSAALGAVAIGGPTLLSACSEVPQSGGEGGQSTLQRVKEQGLINIGIAGEVPYGFTDASGEVTGEAPEVAKAVFKAMGIPEVKATQVEFAQLIQALNASQYDMVAAGMAILPKRCKNAAFSHVDYVTPTAFLVPEGNPKNVKKFSDIKSQGLQVAVFSGSVEQSVAEAAGVPEGNVQAYDDQAGILQAVTDERVYCGSLTDISLKTLVKQNPDVGLEVTDGFVPVIDGEEQIQAGGFVFRKGEQEILSSFNTELDKLHESGQWLEIVKEFGFTEDNVPPSDVTTEQLCKA